jgi:hypothetical protein
MTAPRRPCRGCDKSRVTITRAEYKRLNVEASRGREAMSRANDLVLQLGDSRDKVRRLTNEAALVAALLDGLGIELRRQS